MVLLDVFRVYEYIKEEEVGRLSHKGGGHAQGGRRAPCLVDSSSVS